MTPFFRYARRMLDKPALLAGAVVMAFVSAASLGGGMLAVVPVLRNILPATPDQPGSTLPQLAQRFNDAREPGAFTIPQNVIDALPDGRFNAVLVIIIGLGVLTVIGAAANFLHQSLAFTVSITAVARIRRRAFAHLLRMPLLSVVGRSDGGGSDLVTRVLQDVGVLARGFQIFVGRALAQLSKGFFAFLSALIIDWRLTLATVAVAPVLAVIVRKLGKAVRRATRGAMRSRGELLAIAYEVIGGYRTVKASANETYELGRFTKANDELVREQLRERTARALSGPLVETITIIILGALALVAAKAIIDGELDPAKFFVTLTALAIAGTSLKPFSAFIQELQAANASAERMDELFNLAAEPNERAPRLPRHTQSISFNNVSLTYPNAEHASLTNISLKITHGERVAFVGPNGSGKTTLLSLVPRLFDPTDGTVLIDDTELTTVSLRSLRKQIAVVSQEVVLFKGTVAQNIAYGTRGASREDIARAADRAHATPFIDALPKGLDTPVGEQGLTLSGGQRQRVAIARAILRDPAILILDEATSMIDTESEAAITKALDDFSGGRTTLVVAHRLSTVVNADRIVVLDQGRIVDVAPHAELLDRCPLYRDLAKHQLSFDPARA